MSTTNRITEARFILSTAGKVRKGKAEKVSDAVGENLNIHAWTYHKFLVELTLVNAYERVTDDSGGGEQSDLSDAAKEIWQELEPAVQNWEKGYEILVHALDVVSELHPVIKRACSFPRNCIAHLTSPKLPLRHSRPQCNSKSSVDKMTGRWVFYVLL